MDVQIGRFREIFSTKLAVMPYSFMYTSFVLSKFTRIAKIFMADVTFLGKIFAFVNHFFMLPQRKFCRIGFVTSITSPSDFIVIRIGMISQAFFAGVFLIAYFTL